MYRYKNRHEYVIRANTQASVYMFVCVRVYMHTGILALALALCPARGPGCSNTPTTTYLVPRLFL